MSWAIINHQGHLSTIIFESFVLLSHPFFEQLRIHPALFLGHFLSNIFAFNCKENTPNTALMSGVVLLKSSLHILDRVQSKAIRLINNPNLTNSPQSLFHRRLAADLSIFYRYFHGHCSQEIKNIISDPVRRVRITRSSTYSHPFQVTLPNP